MTHHSDVNYQCRACGTGYIPLPGYPQCPKCSTLSAMIFSDFVEDALHSAIYNLWSHRNFDPGIWGTFTTGDAYYALAFDFLIFTAGALKVPQSKLLATLVTRTQAQELAEKFISGTNLEGQIFMADSFKHYCTALLLSPNFTQENQIKTFERIAAAWKRVAGR
jgi:hypothetical protein